jgi:hypothetical protein
MAQPSDNIHNLFTPQPDEMLAHAEHLFGGYLGGCHDGLIELAWTDTTTHALRHARLYGTDELEELVAHAVMLNIQQGCNVYLGAALRKPGTAPFARAKDSDFFALTCAYADLDEPGAATTAKDKYGTAKPTKVVITGRTPHARAQLWWRLDEPIVDPRLSEGLLKGLAKGLDGDPTVVNASRVMRLAGSVAWPVKDGRVTEMTSLLTPKEPLARSYTWGHLARLFPPAQPQAAPQTPQTPPIDPDRVVEADGITRRTTPLGFEGEVVDGREAYMLKTITACLIQLCGAGMAPTVQALFDLAWPQFSRGCDISKPRANGQPWTAEAFWAKCLYTLQRFTEGKIQGVRSLDEAKAIHALKQAAYAAGGGKGQYDDVSGDFGPGQQNAGQQAPPRPAQSIAVLPAFPIDAATIPVRNWVVPALLLRGSVTVLVAPPGSGKSLLTLQMAIAIAAGIPWGGFTPRKREKVLIINAEDDLDEMRRRLVVAAAEMGVDQADLVGWLDLAKAPETIVICKIDSRSKAVVRMPLADDLIQTVADGGYGLVVADPFAETFVGDENSNSEVKWAGVLWREVARKAGVALWLVHHTKKYSGNMAGDADASRGGGAMIGIARVLVTLFNMTEEEATAMDIDPDNRTDYVRLDDGKANYSRKGNAKWFEKVTKPVGNATAFLPSDEVGVLVPWQPPDALAGITIADINAALDVVDRGLLDEHGKPTGRFWSPEPNARSRWVGSLLMRELECSRPAALKLVNGWLKSGTLVTFNYFDNGVRKQRSGVKSDLTKRPGAAVFDD